MHQVHVHGRHTTQEMEKRWRRWRSSRRHTQVGVTKALSAHEEVLRDLGPS